MLPLGTWLQSWKLQQLKPSEWLQKWEVEHMIV
jgi:hypothetical protein